MEQASVKLVEQRAPFEFNLIQCRVCGHNKAHREIEKLCVCNWILRAIEFGAQPTLFLLLADDLFQYLVSHSGCVCVCVFVCVRERKLTHKEQHH